MARELLSWCIAVSLFTYLIHTYINIFNFEQKVIHKKYVMKIIKTTCLDMFGFLPCSGASRQILHKCLDVQNSCLCKKG
ncbi:hypothetical protein NQ317_019395 [Molorchus minor]|uniref:Uncharacterized protein n=1 Tax=Molorchus minor TaxID=1323400 RepID=A0ABQ9JF06_9CUCU|nr:hypothetical protein NQ317_019395 [Molorchus minor]